MLVLFHTPAVPLATCSSDAKTNPHSRDSYQPSDKVDHSKRCTRMDEGSMPGMLVAMIVLSAVVVSVLEDRSGESV